MQLHQIQEKGRFKIFKEKTNLSKSCGLGLQSEGCGFDPRPMLDLSGVKAMPGSIPTPNSGSL